MPGKHGDVGLLAGQNTLRQGLGGAPVEIPRAVVLHLETEMLRCDNIFCWLCR